jgi:uncharacterized protein (TIGR00162 family)
MAMTQLSMGKGVTRHKVPHLDNPILIAAWPGMGNVAVRAASFLREKLHAEEFAEIEAGDFFPLSGVTIRDNLVDEPRLPKSKFYSWRSRRPAPDIMIFIGDAQPSSGKEYAFANLVMDIVVQFGVERLYTFAAMPSNIGHTQVPRVWGVATHAELIEILREFGVHIMSYGHISGLNGSLLGVAKMRGIGGICLLGELPYYATQIENPRASKAVLEVLGNMLDIHLDMTELENLAEYTEAEIERYMRQIKEEIQLERMLRKGEKGPGYVH